MVARIKKGDQVFVNCGKDIGKTGEVLRMLGSSAIVQGVNVVKRHQKQDQKNEGGILSKELPIDVSNIMPVDTKTKKGSRIGYQKKKDGKKVRILIKSGEQLDG